DRIRQLQTEPGRQRPYPRARKLPTAGWGLPDAYAQLRAAPVRRPTVWPRRFRPRGDEPLREPLDLADLVPSVQNLRFPRIRAFFKLFSLRSSLLAARTFRCKRRDIPRHTVTFRVTTAGKGRKSELPTDGTLWVRIVGAKISRFDPRAQVAA